MIVGVMLRHYKNYENVNFLPISDNIECKYTVYVGNNGVGKSGILESLDVILNNREWNITSGVKKSEAYICPVFLIKKDTVNNYLVEYEFISNYYWNVDDSTNLSYRNTSAVMTFFNFKNKIKEKYEANYFLILIGMQNNDRHSYFSSTFDSDFINKFSENFNIEKEEARDVLDNIRDEIFDRYNYLYIPVEQSLNELLKLENNEMQMLLNKNLLNEIEQILTKKQDGVGNKSIVKQINEYLDKFIEQVNEAISSVDETYSFSTEGNYKKSLTAKDIREKILEAYFPLRVLKRSGRKISQLSSGEQRKALIDVAYSVLVANGDNDTEREVILAIDEPETSMHISNCFNQFMMLESLAKIYGKQVILTTHWYGFLPITQFGNMHHISRKEDNRVKIDTFDFYNYLEDRRNYPDVIELKSMFDLATSILTYMRNKTETNWIICEGSDDKAYLDCMFEEEDNLKILPVGGCGNVVKLFQLLYSPMTEKEEVQSISSKILFLIDTDVQFKQVNKPLALSGGKKDNIFIRRLQIDNGEICLIDPTILNNTYAQTEIEDCLIPQIYYDSLVDVINTVGTENERYIMSKYTFVTGAKQSRLKGDNSCIVVTDISYIQKKEVIVNFAENSDNKYLIAKKYVEKYKQSSDRKVHELKIVISKCLDI